MPRHRSLGSSENADDAAVDISPLIDCVFILLIFFIVTTTFVKDVGVEVNKPQTMSQEQLEKQSIMIAVTDEGQVVYGGEAIGVAGVRQLVRRELAKDSEVPVIIKADSGSPAGTLIEVVDAAKLAQAKKVSIATEANN
jgi:biopolymer transport protein ExbD